MTNSQLTTNSPVRPPSLYAPHHYKILDPPLYALIVSASR